MSSPFDTIRCWSGWSPLDRQLADLLLRESRRDAGQGDAGQGDAGQGDAGQDSACDAWVLWCSSALLTWSLRQGDVCVDLEQCAGRPLADVVLAGDREAEDALDRSIGLPDIDAWMSLLRTSELASMGDGNRPMVLAGRRLYLNRYWGHELALATRLVERSSRVERPLVPEDIRACLERWFEGASKEARLAAAVAVEHRLCIVTGGPGTGKTTTIVRLLGLLTDLAQRAQRRAPRILLLAPTGKAAARLSEAIRSAKEQLGESLPSITALPSAASTIHRALAGCAMGTDGSRLPLSADILVVDEASMVDLAMMRRLMDAAAPIERTIIVGDPDQLASVQAGAVLAELCSAYRMASEADRLPEPVPSSDGRTSELVVELTKTHRFRQDGGIGALARCIKGSDPAGALALFERADPELRFIEPGRDANSLIESIARRGYRALWDSEQPEQALSRLEQFRVLCAHRRGRFGVQFWNEQIRRTHQFAPRSRATPWPGEPVLITENSRDGLLHNGDLGILWHESSGARGWFALADARVVGLGQSRLGRYDLAYAMTIHKCQGSEVDEVLIVLPEADSPLLTRELLYTAVTRARKACTLVATRDAVRKAITQRSERRSGLALAISRQMFGESSQTSLTEPERQTDGDEP